MNTKLVKILSIFSILALWIFLNYVLVSAIIGADLFLYH